MKRHIIIAPHADDEIIGCYSILNTGGVAEVSFPITNKKALEEAQHCNELFGFVSSCFSTYEDVLELARKANRNGGLIFLPDPVYELHPDHRVIGSYGVQLIKQYQFHNIVFYTTNMNAPYMQESKRPDNKKRDLDNCYSDKKSLWEYDHKYFLFEGYTTWNLPKELL